MLTLRLQREADGVAVPEEAVDDGEADEGDAARDAHGARRGVAPGRALGVRVARRAAPPAARGLAVPAAAAGQERGAQVVHLRLKALRAPEDAHAACRSPPGSGTLPRSPLGGLVLVERFASVFTTSGVGARRRGRG